MKAIALFLPLIAILLLITSCSTPSPNLVLIITDDQGYGDLSLHGNTILETPHLDALGTGGVRLDNFHVSPVCAPTRAAVLTGRRPMSSGAYWVTRGGETMDHEEYTLAEVLKDNAYATGCFGKWHNGAHHPHHPLSQGFDEFYGFTAGHLNRYFNPELEHNGKMVQDEGYIADLLTDRAIEYIRDRAGDPFFCYLAYNTPHSPFQLPDAYYDMYIDRVEEKDSALKIMNASVYGMVKNIDDNVGRLMDVLRELSLEENTIVLFMTDNGPNTTRFNGNMKGKKGWVNDGGVRVPCFIRWKDHLPENKVVRSMSAHIDLLPTLTGLMGVYFQAKREIHGVDLGPRILGEDREQERFLFTHVNHGMAVRPAPGAVRTGKWRLTFTNPDHPELTLRSDAGETENLAGSERALTDSLKSLYFRWFRKFEDFQIPPIPVGVVDSVILPGHEAYIHGGGRYFWSDNGWSNDWLTGLAGSGDHACWEVNVKQKGSYECRVRYASSEGPVSLAVECGQQALKKELPAYIPVKDQNYSRIDRATEAIGQSWARASMGNLHLENGAQEIIIRAGRGDAEVHSLILYRKQ